MMQAPLSTSNFKPWRQLFWLLLFCMVVAVTIYGVGNIYYHASTKNKINAFNQRRFEDFYASPPLDLIFIGSSHSYCTFDPEIFDETLGTHSFQLGLPSQHPDTSYYTLLEVLRYQQPKDIVMELYFDMLDDDFELKQTDTLFQVLENEQLKNDFIQNVFPMGEKTKYKINAIRFQQDFLSFANRYVDEKIQQLFHIEKPTKEIVGSQYYRSKGYIYCDYVIDADEYDRTNQFRKMDGKNFRMSPVQREYIEKIVQKCQEAQIRLHFVTAPLANVSMEKIKNYQMIHDQVAALAQQWQVDYVDYNIINQEKHFLQNEDFQDDAHLNDQGVQIVSKDYARYLQSSGFIPMDTKTKE